MYALNKILLESSARHVNLFRPSGIYPKLWATPQYHVVRALGASSLASTYADASPLRQLLIRQGGLNAPLYVPFTETNVFGVTFSRQSMALEHICHLCTFFFLFPLYRQQKKKTHHTTSAAACEKGRNEALSTRFAVFSNGQTYTINVYHINKIT